MRLLKPWSIANYWWTQRTVPKIPNRTQNLFNPCTKSRIQTHEISKDRQHIPERWRRLTWAQVEQKWRKGKETEERDRDHDQLCAQNGDADGTTRMENQRRNCHWGEKGTTVAWRTEAKARDGAWMSAIGHESRACSDLGIWRRIITTEMRNAGKMGWDNDLRV